MPRKYPEIFYLPNAYDRIRIYREWCFGRNTVFREPQKADMRNDRLAEDFSNLGLFFKPAEKSAQSEEHDFEGAQGTVRWAG
jgi:hypothetical protein